MIDTKEVLQTYGFEDYEALKTYFAGKYNDDEKAWQKLSRKCKTKDFHQVWMKAKEVTIS